jgi:hypothetical protein
MKKNGRYIVRPNTLQTHITEHDKTDASHYIIKKKIAHQIITKGLKNGSIKPPDYCVICHKMKRLVAHHPDYDKPLDVLWICLSCHRKVHLAKFYPEMQQYANKQCEQNNGNYVNNEHIEQPRQRQRNDTPLSFDEWIATIENNLGKPESEQVVIQPWPRKNRTLFERNALKVGGAP